MMMVHLEGSPNLLGFLGTTTLCTKLHHNTSNRLDVETFKSVKIVVVLKKKKDLGLIKSLLALCVIWEP